MNNREVNLNSSYKSQEVNTYISNFIKIDDFIKLMVIDKRIIF